jgi:hypothetical protein
VLSVYSRDRFIALLEPVPFVRYRRLQALLELFGDRLASHGLIGDYLVNEGVQILREILLCHEGYFPIEAIADDYELIDRLFSIDIPNLNLFEPCAEARKPRPHLPKDPVTEKLIIKSSGDREMDILADLASLFQSYDQARKLFETLNQSQIDAFSFRLIERKRDTDDLMTEQGQEYFFNEWLQQTDNRDYLNNMLSAVPT